jgi:hypothetical protein
MLGLLALFSAPIRRFIPRRFEWRNDVNAVLDDSQMAFYADPVVRTRLMEFLGEDTAGQTSAVYITRSDGVQLDSRMLRLPAEIDWFLGNNLDIARSLADSAAILMHLDVEYVSFAHPAEAYENPERAFGLQEPVVRAIEAQLLRWGIKPLHLITGQGHHFVWKIDRESELAKKIEALSPTPELTERCMARVPPFLQGRITPQMQEIFSGVGLIMEYVAHCVKEEAGASCSIPIELTAVHVDHRGSRRREIISIDISEYGDPLHTRMVRLPFTNYRKPKLMELTGLLPTGEPAQTLRAIPLHEMDVHMALKVRRSESEVRDLARRACVRIPDQTLGSMKLFNEYMASRLRHFHEYYYSTRHDPEERWPETYDHTPMEPLPPCVRHIVQNPNDLLLKPAGMQLVARTFLAQGWHPRHIAGYIRSRFDKPEFGWGVNWNDYDTATRADFYVRNFIGQYETRLDRLEDYNCASTQEKGFCCAPDDPGCCLLLHYESLIERQHR